MGGVEQSWRSERAPGRGGLCRLSFGTLTPMLRKRAPSQGFDQSGVKIPLSFKGTTLARVQRITHQEVKVGAGW